jgi:hypothetical protein
MRPGERLGISRQITDLGFGCRREGSVSWSDVYAGIGGGHVFLRDGDYQESDDLGGAIRDPRTAVCLNSEFVYFVVVDGRRDGVSEGMRYEIWRVLPRRSRGAGVNQDGGVLNVWINGQIVNERRTDKNAVWRTG